MIDVVFNLQKFPKAAQEKNKRTYTKRYREFLLFRYIPAKVLNASKSSSIAQLLINIQRVQTVII